MAYYAPQPAPYPASATMLAAHPSAFAAPGPALPPSDAPWAPPPPLPPQQHLHAYAPAEPVLFDAAPRPCPLSCCAPIAPPPPPISTVPVYNVSYSLAGALTPVDAPRPIQRAQPAQGQLPSPLCSVAPLWFGVETPSPSSGALSYVQDGGPSSSEEYFYEPETSSCSSLSPSPPPVTPFVSVKKEEFSPASLSAAGGPSARERAAAKGRPRRDKSRTGSLLTGDQQYVCDICGVAFIRKHDGERHRRSHTGERPFPCHGGCGKAFRRADARSRHWGVYRECEWRHTMFLEGTPEGARRERRLLKRAKRAELVAQGVARPLIERILKKM